MSILKLISDIDKATKAIDKITDALEPKPRPPKKALTIEEREARVKNRIREKGLQATFRDIFPDL